MVVLGHCVDIDGDWWHPPGECRDFLCRERPCCVLPEEDNYL